MNKLVTAVIIGYKSKDLLKACIESIKAQSYKNIEVIFIDNHGGDGSCEYVEKHFPEITCICNNENIGYGRAANQGIKLAKGEYVQIMNPDIIFESAYIQNCIHKMEKDKAIGVISGKLFKYNFSKNHKTNYIDTVGLFSYKNRRIIDDGQGLEDLGQFEEEKEVFGVSGACPIFRKSALNDINLNNEYFDENFFMYKEDIDICWRLRLRAWKCWYLPSAIANHGRGTGTLKRFSHLEVLKNRSKLNKFQKYHSWKNQRLMQIKNEYLRGFFKNFFSIVFKEMLITGYLIFREPFLIKAFFQLIGQIPSTLKKRNSIMKSAKADWKDMEKWLSGKQSQYLHE